MTIITPENAKCDWDAVAHDYAACILTVEAICASHSIARSALYRHAYDKGWPLRRDMSAKAPTADARTSGTKKQAQQKSKSSSDRPAQKKASQTKRSPAPDLTSRLLAALDYKMTEFENRMAQNTSSTKANAADSERDARTLNTLVRLFEKLNGFGEKSADTERAAMRKPASGAAPAAASSADSSVKDAHDADRLRNDLAQRLERLRGQIGG